ncbi:MAG: hypothetical protein PHR17_09065 [Aminobacterium sp.]|nr:hypothetical protein [Aminobacterium sp.]
MGKGAIGKKSCGASFIEIVVSVAILIPLIAGILSNFYILSKAQEKSRKVFMSGLAVLYLVEANESAMQCNGLYVCEEHFQKGGEGCVKISTYNLNELYRNNCLYEIFFWY